MTRAKHIRRVCAVVASSLTVMLSGCAGLAPIPITVSPAPRALAGDFILEGRLSATDGEQAASGRLEWEHSPTGDAWLLFSPLGQMVAELIATEDGVTLRTADGKTHHARSAEEMLPVLLGVPAPLDGLVHWVQAVPRTGARVLAADASGRPARVTDEGWIIDYPEYRSDAPDALPRRIDAAWGDARIRLTIDQWTTAR